MRLDSLTRLIEAADVAAFREIALLYLRASGYEEVALRDGPHDGGSDISLWSLGQNPEPIAVQVSIQKSNWKGKVRQDAQRAKDNYGHQVFLYITSRRLEPTEVTQLTETLWSTQRITLRTVDSQSLASKFYLDGKATSVLDALGIARGGRSTKGDGRSSDMREDLAFAYAFFGTDVDTFRQAGLERSIAAYLTRDEVDRARAEVVVAVGKALKLPKTRHRLIEAQIDRMMQRGDLLTSKGDIYVSDAVADAHRAARAVRNRQWRQLESQIGTALGAAGLRGASLEKAATSVSDAAGALMLSTAAATNAAFAAGGDVGPARQQIRVKLNRLSRDLSKAGLDVEAHERMMGELAELISKSDIGQALLAGDLFLSLLSMESSELLKALGGHEDLEVFLDASVAIPMLASLLYEPHDQRFFRAAHYAYEQATQHGVRLSVPQDYLEEAASHLLDAYDKYRPLLDKDSDLRFSRNAFVSHYLAIRHVGSYDNDFARYAESYGLRLSTGQERHFTTERNMIMARMKTLFSRYQIHIVEPRTVPREARRRAQEAITYTARELELDRAQRLLDHDARAVADISSRAAAGERAVMFCTWDRLHLRLRTAGGSVDWNALDPAMLGDLLALVSPEEDTPVGGMTDAVLELGESDARQGAEIWDELVQIEGGKFYDADLLERAQGFKNAYMEAAREKESPEPLAAAWTKWKESAE